MQLLQEAHDSAQQERDLLLLVHLLSSDCIQLQRRTVIRSEEQVLIEQLMRTCYCQKHLSYNYMLPF